MPTIHARERERARPRAGRWRLRAVGALLVLAAAATMLVTTTQAASSGVTVTATIPSSIALTNNCANAANYQFGTVLPGAGVTTATAGNACSFTFQSTNDTSMIRLSQRDGTGAAMGTSTTTYSQAGSSGKLLQDIASYNDQIAYAVGQGPYFAYTTNGGASWTAATIPGDINGGDFFGVAVSPTNSSIVWAVGWDGSGNPLIVRTQTGGTGALPFDNTAGVTKNYASGLGFPAAEYLSEASMPTATTLLVAGYNGRFASSTNANGASPTFTASTIPGITAGAEAEGLASPDGTNAYFVGDGKMKSTANATAAAPTWTDHSDSNFYNDIAACDTSHVYAVGEPGILRMWNGAAWATRTTNAADALQAVACQAGTPANVWAVGQHGTTVMSTDSGVTVTRGESATGTVLMGVSAQPTAVWEDGYGSIVQRSTNGGSTFTPVKPFAGGFNATSIAADPANGQNLMEVGDGGQFRTSTTGGSAWNAPGSASTHNLLEVTYASSQVAWAVGDAGTIVQTTNADQAVPTWTAQASGTTVRLDAVAVVDPYTAVAVGDLGTAVRTTNGGATWTPVTIPGAAKELREASASGQSVMVIGADARVWYSTNGGATFVAATTNPGVAGDFSSAIVDIGGGRGYAITQWAKLYRTTDSGANWTFVSNVPNGGSSVLDLDASPDGTYIAAVGDWSYAFFSTDSGSSWTKQSKSQWLTDVVVLDDNSAVYSSSNGNTVTHVPSGSATQTINNYGVGPNNWAGSGTSSMFGVCIQAVGAGTTANSGGGWNVDGSGVCQAVDTDPWMAVPAAPVKIVQTTAGTAGRVDLVWGLRTRTDQAPGSYSATVVIDALAPAV